MFQKTPLAKKFMDKRGGILRLSIEKIFSHSAENFRRGGGEFFSVSLISGIEKI